MSALPSPERPPSPRLAALPTLADVYRAHAADVGRWAGRLGGPGVDVDDIVQDVFIIVNRHIARFRGDAKLTTWLFRITDRVVRNHRRWRKVRRILTRLTSHHGDRIASGQPGPLEWLERNVAAVTAYGVLDQLPERLRRVLILSDVEGLSAEEIARLLDARVDTVRVWQHRARRMFTERVKGLEADQTGRLTSL